MLTQLAHLSARKFVGSFALRTPFNDFWMKVGQRFHAKNRMTKLYMFSYDQVERSSTAPDSRWCAPSESSSSSTIRSCSRPFGAK